MPGNFQNPKQPVPLDQAGNKPVGAHVHNGVDSPKINTADFVRVLATAPTGMGREGEMIFVNTGSSYSIFVWLNGDWREFPYTP